MTMTDDIFNSMQKKHEKKDDVDSTKINDVKINDSSNNEYRPIEYKDILKMTWNTVESAFLISELLRFMNENARLPTNKDMNSKFGYPNSAKFYTYYGGVVYQKKGVKGAIEHLYTFCSVQKLKVPFVESTEKVSTKLKYDFFANITSNLLTVLTCKTDGKSYHKYRNIVSEDYGKIDFKFSSLNNNMWIFNLHTKIEDNQDIDNFICVGIDHKITKIEYIWVIPNNKFNDIKNLTTCNTIGSLKRLEQYNISDVFNYDRLIM